MILFKQIIKRGAWWLSGRVLDYKSRGPLFKNYIHLSGCVHEQGTFNPRSACMIQEALALLRNIDVWVLNLKPNYDILKYELCDEKMLVSGFQFNIREQKASSFKEVGWYNPFKKRDLHRLDGLCFVFQLKQNGSEVCYAGWCF